MSTALLYFSFKEIMLYYKRGKNLFVASKGNEIFYDHIYVEFPQWVNAETESKLVEVT